MDVKSEDFMLGIQAYEKNEGRDSMYRVATFLLDQWWGETSKMVDALSVLLLTWNNAFHRYGMFNQDAVEEYLRTHWNAIKAFHSRDIRSLDLNDQGTITNLFMGMLKATQTKAKNGEIKRSSVGVAKALHLLAPNFFPIWDKSIAWKYECVYVSKPAEVYFRFCKEIQRIAEQLGKQEQIKDFLQKNPEKTLVKRIDEFNYSKFSKHWI